MKKNHSAYPAGVGEQDGMIPFANSNDYLLVVAGSELVSFKGVAHLPYEEAPVESIGEDREFLLVPPATP